jgi:ApbE superfamily uncharacterized protein (UPF0280 family)
VKSRPKAVMLADGRRLHLQHGPIDLILEGFGAKAQIDAAYQAACLSFEDLLEELTDELALLRAPASSHSSIANGRVARRMQDAVLPYADEIFITPMAAVAGSVADEILAAMTGAAKLARAYVNNGGDIALHLDDGEEFSVGLVNRPDRPEIFGHSLIRADQGVRGLATSGWRGRSFSLGIADAVTTLAANAAMADAAATVVANAVDLPGNPAIVRHPAREIRHDSDLGDRLVTIAVAELRAGEIALALARGQAMAERLASGGLIAGAALHLSGETRLVDLPSPTEDPSCPISSSASASSSSRRFFMKADPQGPSPSGAAPSSPSSATLMPGATSKTSRPSWKT